MRTDCSNCFFQEGCERDGACEHYFNLYDLSEQDLGELIEQNRKAYHDEFTQYMSEWCD